MKTIRFDCRSCQQTIEVPQRMGGSCLVCPSCHNVAHVPGGSVNTWPLTAMVILCGCFAIAGFWNELHGIQKANSDWESEPENQTLSAYEKQSRWRIAALQEITNSCRKDVVGFSRVADVFLYDQADPPNWYARVKVDHLNEIGGTSRTNLFYIFGVINGGNGVWCSTIGDSDKVFSLRSLRAATTVVADPKAINPDTGLPADAKTDEQLGITDADRAAAKPIAAKLFKDLGEHPPRTE